MFVAGRRIDAFMTKAEIDENAINKIATATSAKAKSADEENEKVERTDLDVQVKGASFSWTPEGEGASERGRRVGGEEGRPKK